MDRKREGTNGRMDPDKEWDTGNRFPPPPKMPDEIKGDPKKKKMSNEYWEKARDEGSAHMRDQKNRDKRRD